MPNLQKDITQVYWQPLQSLLNPTGPKVQALEGFDSEFVDLVDYIIRITHRIWEQKNIGLCYDYYADICPVYMLGGYCESVDDVVANTLKTIAAFPDRSLIGENVIHKDEGDGVYYSSHLITSIMTNCGDSEFGPATNKTGRVTTIADCVCKANRIIEEWLVRDNSFLVKQLGIDPIDAARHMAKSDANSVFTSWYTSEYARVMAHDHRQQCELEQWTNIDDFDGQAFAQSWLQTLFNRKQFSQIDKYYKGNAKLQWPGGRKAVGCAKIAGTLIQWLAQCPDARVSCDHVGVTYFDDNTVDVAIRWGLAGHFNPQDKRLAHSKGQELFVLGASHLRISNGKIESEITVFDEVAMYANLLRDGSQSLAMLGGKIDA
ncbi:nuclear transport factor 2 family protein [Thalassotalea sp. HSM 43]|uniref:ester cyclase n=1 Tax=Thalassotalea sp. HSM 43 TaxID=2552945 RepID=UPI001080B293|nr:ester cyclase [Thalassotalea sp. HSM 43]QBY04205.1 nuclear transport factor 2 family protein [Thalassotalea sp. HSM 43]